MEYLAAGTPALGAAGKLFAVFLDGDLLEGIQIPLDVGPLECVAGPLQAVLQRLHQEKGEEAAEGMAPDGLVGLVEDGPRFKNALHLPEKLLHIQFRRFLEAINKTGHL